MTIYSHSRLSCYEQCPQKYKFQYTDKIKIEVKESIEVYLGRRVHETLEKLYRNIQYRKLNTLEELLGFLRDKWNRNWNNSIEIVKREHGPDEYLKMAEKYITDYYNRYKPFNHGRTIALEKRILIDLDGSGNYRLIAYVDRITKSLDGYYEIHDYKTSSRLPSLGRIKNDRQLALYSIGVKERYPDVKDVRLIWHFLKFDKEIDSIRTEEELEELKLDIIKRIDEIENAVEFPADPSRLCNWCMFKPICRH